MNHGIAVSLPEFLNPNFPPRPEPEVSRDNILETIQSTFARDIDVVLVEGEEGTGKTTLLAQYARANPKSSVTAFIRSANRWSYDIGYFQLDLCAQLHWLLEQEELPDDIEITRATVEQYFKRISRKWRWKRDRQLTVIIDGLENVPNNEPEIISSLIKSLPIGRGGFRFLFSGGTGEVEAALPKAVRRKSFPIPGFTTEEAKQFFSGLEIPKEDVLRLRKMFQGKPGRLATVRRVLDKGTNVDDVLTIVPEEVSRLYQLEWRDVEDLPDVGKNALAIICFHDKPYTVEEMSEFLDSEADEMAAMLGGIGFIEILEDEHEVRFVSESFRRYAQERLRNRREPTRQEIIARLSRQPQSEESFTYLPEFLAETGQYETLLKYLSGENVAEMVKQARSAGAVRRKANLGMSSAKQLRRDGDLIRFGLAKSIISELSGMDVWKSEVKARMSLGRQQSAEVLARGTHLAEDRLHLLAIVARMLKQDGKDPDQDLIDDIRLSYEAVDLETVKARAPQIASELIHTCPDLAIDLIKKCSTMGESENSLDFALALLSVSAASSEEAGEEGSGLTEEIRKQIATPELRSVPRGASLLFGDYSADDVISKMEEFTNTSEAIFLVREWMSINREKPGILKAVRYGLDRAIASTDYSPTAKVYRELAAPLEDSADDEEVEALLRKFDGQSGSIERLGPTLEFVRLQCSLARAERSLNPTNAVDRLLDVFLYADDVEDVPTRLAALAELRTTLDKVDPDEEFAGGKLAAHDEIRKCYRSAHQELLSELAYQFKDAEEALAILAPFDIAEALAFAESLNTAQRRAQAAKHVVSSALKGPRAIDRLDDIIQAGLAIRTVEDRDTELIDMLRHAAGASGAEDDRIKPVLKLVDAVDEIANLSERCRAYCLFLIVLTDRDIAEDGLAERFKQRLHKAWSLVDSDWSRIEIGFQIAALLSEAQRGTAEEYLRVAEELKADTPISSGSHQRAYFAGLDLVSRAWQGLISQDHDREIDLLRIEEALDAIPSVASKVVLWGTFALRASIAGRQDLCELIVVNHVRPGLDGLKEMEGNRHLYQETVEDLVPALYMAHRATALDRIDKLSEVYRDRGLARVARFIFRGCLPGEPYSGRKADGYDIDYDEAVELLNICQRVSNEGQAYHILRDIARSITEHGDTFSYQQKGEISRRLRELSLEKFPTDEGVDHDGYVIAGLACALSIKPKGSEDWEVLLDRARGIANTADRAFVIGSIANAMPSGRYGQHDVFGEAINIAKTLPSIHDRFERHLNIAEWAFQHDEAISRRCIRAGFETSIEEGDSNVREAQRQAIDLAHRIDPEFADALVKLTDPDPARRRTEDFDSDRVSLSRYLGREIRVRNIKGEVSSAGRRALEDAHVGDLAGAGRETLASLNAGQITPLSAEDLREVIEFASNFGLRRSYFWFASVLQSAVKRFSHTDQADTILLPMFEALLISCGFCRQLVAQGAEARGVTVDLDDEGAEKESVVIRAGERDKAVEFVRQWLAGNLGETLTICDPYFGPQDLEVLQLVLSVNRGCFVRILTSRRHHLQGELSKPWSDGYRRAWNSMSEEEPPRTEVMVAGTRRGGNLPIHDRWWISGGAGLRTGTSYSSLGRRRSSEITHLERPETEAREREIERYLLRQKRTHDGERILCELFDL